MHRLSLADELAEVRAEIARLKLRESALRAHFLRHPQEDALGRWHRVEVVESRSLRFAPALLPDHIRQDPRFLQERLVQSVRCLPAPMTTTLRPGWPIPRSMANMH